MQLNEENLQHSCSFIATVNCLTFWFFIPLCRTFLCQRLKHRKTSILTDFIWSCLSWRVISDRIFWEKRLSMSQLAELSVSRSNSLFRKVGFVHCPTRQCYFIPAFKKINNLAAKDILQTIVCSRTFTHWARRLASKERLAIDLTLQSAATAGATS